MTQYKAENDNRRIAPEGHYWSKMCGMFLRKRDTGASIQAERHTMSPRDLLRHVLSETLFADDDAREGKKLASDDASRYGAAAQSGNWKAYHGWRDQQGLTWWLEQERLFPPASNDNASARIAA